MNWLQTKDVCMFQFTAIFEITEAYPQLYNKITGEHQSHRSKL